MPRSTTGAACTGDKDRQGASTRTRHPSSVFKQEETGNPQTSWEEQGQVLTFTSPSSLISQGSRSFKAPALGAGIR